MESALVTPPPSPLRSPPAVALPSLWAPSAGTALDWSTITELNLSHCGLKEISLLDKFCSLIHLKLDHNLLTDVNGVQGCVALRTLDLSYNRFRETLDSREPPHRSPVGKYLLPLTALEALSLDGNGVQTIRWPPGGFVIRWSGHRRLAQGLRVGRCTTAVSAVVG